MANAVYTNEVSRQTSDTTNRLLSRQIELSEVELETNTDWIKTNAIKTNADGISALDTKRLTNEGDILEIKSELAQSVATQAKATVRIQELCTAVSTLCILFV